MEDSKSVVPSGAYGIPKWIMKKGMRYEVDDFIVSPPSLDDGGFMRLRYGHACTHESSLEGTGQDGGMTVEVKDDTLQFSSDLPPTTTTITIGPGGLSVESSSNTPLTTPDIKSDSPGVHPLLVLPMNFGGEPKFVLKVSPPDSTSANKESLGPTAAGLSRDINSRSLENIDAHASSTLLDKVQSLSLNTTPTQSVGSSPVTSPFTTPKNSPTFPRKCIGVTMEPPRKISAHSYFCTKQYQQDIQANLSARSAFKQEAAASVHNKPLEERAIPPEALDPKMMGQRRRHPKPSALREMNFWAPTSM